MTYFRQRGQAAWWLSGVLAIGTGALGWLFYDGTQQQQQLTNELRNANNAITELQRTAAQADSRETELNRQLAQLQLQLNNVDQQGQSQSDQLTQLRAELNQALQQLQTSQQALQTSQQALQTTEQQLQESQANLEEREQQIATLQQAEVELEQQITTLQQAAAALEQQLVETEQQLAATEQELAQQNQQTLLAQRELDSLKGQLDEAATTEQRYLAAREQLALREAQNESYEDTIARLQRELASEATAMEALESSLQKQLLALNQEKQQLVSKLEDGTTAIQFPESILFASGSAELNADGKRSLAQLATALNSFPDYLISIQGHSDSRSISPPTNQRYPTNWELSSARAAAAVRELIAAGIDKGQLQAVGYADARPLVPETNAASLQKNRRIEVILIPNAFNTKVLNPEQ